MDNNNLIKSIFVITLIQLSSINALAEPVKIATSNIEHLRDTNSEGPNDRSDPDDERLAKYVRRMNAIVQY
jgi:hypothetical protein